MQGPMFEEIKSFYNRIRNEGIYWSDYIDHKKYLRNKIDDKVDDLLSLNRHLFMQGSITKEQYLTMQNKIKNTKIYYKKLVAIC